MTIRNRIVSAILALAAFVPGAAPSVNGVSVVAGLSSAAILASGVSTPALAAWGFPGGYGSGSVQIMYDYFVSQGLSSDDAYAIIGNMSAESGGFRHVQEIRPYKSWDPKIACSDAEVRAGLAKGRGAICRGGLGYLQWSQSRRDGFEDYLRTTGADAADPTANAAYFLQEMNSNPRWRASLDRMRAAGSLAEKNMILVTEIIKPGGYQTAAKQNERLRFVNNVASGNLDYTGSQDTRYAGGSVSGTYGPNMGPNGPLIETGANGGFMNFRAPSAPYAIPVGTT